jgi:lysophospholipase L1-like esterase
MRRPVLGAGIAVVSVVAAAVLIRTSTTLGRTQPVSYATGGGPAGQSTTGPGDGGPVRLALGDSPPAGAGPGTRGTRLVKLGCPGETTGTMVRGGLCDYPVGTVTSGTSLAGSQLAAATSYLAAHPGQVSLITIDIGANDLSSCLPGPDGAAVRACVQRAIPIAEQNLAGILAGLRFAGYRSTIVATTEDEPGLSQPLLAPYNRALRAVYQTFGVQVAPAAATSPGDSGT